MMIEALGRKPFLAPAIWLLVVILAGYAGAQPAPPEWPAPNEIAPDPIDYSPPEPREERLSNGIIVYLIEDRSLPLVQGVAYVKAPSLYDPEDKTGLASMTAALLREGGAGDSSADEIDVRLEQLAASIEASADDVLASVGFDALSDTVPEVLPLWRDMLTAPRFEQQRIEVLRQRQVEAIRRIQDDPVQLALREFFYRVAPNHPVGAYPTEATIGAITREDLLSFHASYFAPQNTAIAISGDFEGDEMLATLEELLGDWEASPRQPPQLPELADEPEPRVYLGVREIAQSVIVMGHPAVHAYTAAYNDLDVASHILGGGGFTSRLFEEIRTRRGLAYSTATVLTQAFDHPGLFVAYSISPGGATVEVAELIRSEIERLRTDGVTEAELERARQTIINQSLFRYESAAAIGQRAARVSLLGLEPEYYERYLANVQEIEPEEVLRIAREELHPQSMVTVVIGNPDLFDRPLEELGEVETVDLE